MKHFELEVNCKGTRKVVAEHFDNVNELISVTNGREVNNYAWKYVGRCLGYLRP